MYYFVKLGDTNTVVYTLVNTENNIVPAMVVKHPARHNILGGCQSFFCDIY